MLADLGLDRVVARAPAEMWPGDEVLPGDPLAGENLCRVCSGSGKVDGEICKECAGAGTTTSIISGDP